MLKFSVMAEIAWNRVSELLADRKGVTAMEYGIIGATTVVIVGTAVAGFSGDLTTIWTNISNALKTAAG